MEIKMGNDKSSKRKPDPILKYLKKTYKKLFNQRHSKDIYPSFKKTLKIGIEKDIYECMWEPKFPMKDIEATLKRYCNQENYLYGIVYQSHRFDLDNKKVDKITVTEKTHAVKILNQRGFAVLGWTNSVKPSPLGVNTSIAAPRRHPTQQPMVFSDTKS